MILSAGFNINIPDPDKFLAAVADYTECPVTQLTEEDVQDFIKRHIKAAVSTSDTFGILCEEVGTRFVTSVEGGFFGKLMFRDGR